MRYPSPEGRVECEQSATGVISSGDSNSESCASLVNQAFKDIGSFLSVESSILSCRGFRETDMGAEYLHEYD